jgi:hypothetical protein
MLFTLNLDDWATAFFIIENPIVYLIAALFKLPLNNSNSSMMSGWYIG